MKSDEVFVAHILDELNFLLRRTGGLHYETFARDETLTRACVRSLEVIGEAVKNLSPDFRRRHKDFEWKKIAGLRDRLIHGYFRRLKGGVECDTGAGTGTQGAGGAIAETNETLIRKNSISMVKSSVVTSRDIIDAIQAEGLR